MTPARTQKKVAIKFENLEKYTPEFGEYKNQKLILSGDIKNIRWQNNAGDTMVEMTDIALDAGRFHYYLLDRPFNTYLNLFSDDSEFVGPSSDGNGMDVLTGTNDDVVMAGRGGSFIKDAGGADRYEGTESGYYAVTYNGWAFATPAATQGIDVDMRKGRVIGPDGEKDKIFNIDEIRGTIRDDVFVGDGKNNRFSGDRGNDIIDGKGGFDRARYARDNLRDGDGIYADMKKGEVKDGYGTVDKIMNIEGIDSSNSKDIFVSNSDDNWFRGNDGGDRFRFDGKNFGHNTINEFNRGEGDKIVMKAASKLSDLTITYGVDGTLVEFNNNSSVWLDDWTKTLNGSDFIF